MSIPTDSLPRRLLRRLAGQPAVRPVPVPRPPGVLVWLHLGPAMSAAGQNGDGQNGAVQAELVCALAGPGSGRVCLLTGSVADDTLRLPGVQAVQAALPPDTAPAALLWATHWRPDLAVWADDAMHGALGHVLDDLKVPMILALPQSGSATLARRDRTKARAAFLNGFQHILLPDLAEAARIDLPVEAGTRAHFTGPALPVPDPLPDPESWRRRLMRALDGRPAWCLAEPDPAEIVMALEAHAGARRAAPGLVMIVSAPDPDKARILLNGLADAGAEALLSEAGSEHLPGSQTEVVVLTGPDAHGCAYRLAPLTVLGGSFAGQGPVADPCAPVVLGSVLLHGPIARPSDGAHAAALARLEQAGAVLSLPSAAALTEVLSAGLAPDVLAERALAGWQAVTEGAEMAACLRELATLALANRPQATRTTASRTQP